MAISPTYPGVYIEEIPSGVRTITGVSTSVTALVGYTSKGRVNKAVKIFDFGAFEREFGGLTKDSEMGYAVQQFFLNGGSEAWIVRVALGAQKAAITLKSSTAAGSSKSLVVSAKSEGVWGNYLRLDVDYDTANPDSTFNLTVSEYKPQGTELVLARVEKHLNLSMDRDSSQDPVKVINATSEIITVSRDPGVNDALLSNLAAGWSLSGDLSGLTFPADLDNTKRFISIMVDGDGPYEVAIFPAGSSPANLTDLATNIQNAVRGINPGLERFNNFTVQRADALGNALASGNYLLLTSGTPGDKTREQSSVHVLNASNNSASQILKLGLINKGREKEAAAALRPSQTGTTSGDIANLTTTDITGLDTTDQVTVTIADGSTTIATGTLTLGTAVNSLQTLAAQLQKQIRAISAADAFQQTTVQAIGTRLRIVSGTEVNNAIITFANTGGGDLATTIKLDTGNPNVQRYAVGVGVDRAAQVDRIAGNDGTPPNATLLKGKLEDKSGIYALEDVDIFNLLCIPGTAELDDNSAIAVISEAVNYCASKRAFLIVDPPKNRNSLPQIQDWIKNKLTPEKNAALYFPFLQIPDPLENFRLKPVPPSGTIAGLYARTDSARGVWKAPAGTEATLTNVPGFTYQLTDKENGDLNPIAVNCLRVFPVYGRVAWGARTLAGSDQLASEWKYVPVRRLALYIEESLYRGVKWVVFEPNDEPLWAQIRLNVGAFMNNLFRQGAFQGKTPREAYLVKCDKETTTQNDINLGIVNILVGFAPLKPAEFVIIRIQQLAGQRTT